MNACSRLPTDSQYSPIYSQHLRVRGPGLWTPQTPRSTGSSYLCISVDVLIESLECINIEFHQLSQEVKVTLEYIPRLALTVHNAVQDVLGVGEDRVKAGRRLSPGANRQIQLPPSGRALLSCPPPASPTRAWHVGSSDHTMCSVQASSSMEPASLSRFSSEDVGGAKGRARPNTSQEVG